MTVSQPTLKQLQKVTDTGGPLVLFILTHPDFATPIRLVSDTRDWVISGDTYTAMPFSFKMPQDKPKEIPRAALEIDNVGRDIVALLESLSPGAVLMATVRVVHRNTPTVVDFEFVQPMTNIHATMSTITASMGPDDIMRLAAVRLRFDQRTAPGLIPG